MAVIYGRTNLYIKYLLAPAAHICRGQSRSAPDHRKYVQYMPAEVPALYVGYMEVTNPLRISQKEGLGTIETDVRYVRWASWQSLGDLSGDRIHICMAN